jgi:hypothetical protein
LAFYHHEYSNDRAYLITSTKKFYYTTNTGRDWYTLDGPTVPNTFGLQVLHFHPNSDYLIWTGNEGCVASYENCHVEAAFSRDNGHHWTPVERYVRNCQWARDKELKVDATQILCESFANKSGDQRFFNNDNPLELVGGSSFFQKKTKLFNHVAGFAKFSEFLVVAEVHLVLNSRVCLLRHFLQYLPDRGALDIQVSLDGRIFAAGQFPPNMRPEAHASCFPFL